MSRTYMLVVAIALWTPACGNGTGGDRTLGQTCEADADCAGGLVCDPGARVCDAPGGDAASLTDSSSEGKLRVYFGYSTLDDAPDYSFNATLACYAYHVVQRGYSSDGCD